MPVGSPQPPAGKVQMPMASGGPPPGAAGTVGTAGTAGTAGSAVPMCTHHGCTIELQEGSLGMGVSEVMNVASEYKLKFDYFTAGSKAGEQVGGALLKGERESGRKEWERSVSCSLCLLLQVRTVRGN
jgi:hypothetical protein